MLGIDAPALPGRADVGGRPYGPRCPNPSSKTFPGRPGRTANPSASLGMTKGRVGLPLRAVASQTRYLDEAHGFKHIRLLRWNAFPLDRRPALQLKQGVHTSSRS